MKVEKVELAPDGRVDVHLEHDGATRVVTIHVLLSIAAKNPGGLAVVMAEEIIHAVNALLVAARAR